MAPSRSCVSFSNGAASRCRGFKAIASRSEPSFRKRLRLARTRSPEPPDELPQTIQKVLPKRVNPPFYLAVNSRSYGGHIGDPASQNKHEHNIWFCNGAFTLDGKKWRKVSDSKNKDFVQSLQKFKVPAEFRDPGDHKIVIIMTRDKIKNPFHTTSSPKEKEHQEMTPLRVKLAGKRLIG